jgi:hypothetical protein
MAGRLAQEMLEGLAMAVLAIVIVAGSMFVWIGLPLSGLWLAGRITTTPEHFLLLALCAIPTAMVVFGFLLYRVGRVYEMLRGPRGGLPQRTAWLRSSSDSPRRAGAARAPRQLIDTAMIASAWTAVVLMAVWFFFFAEFRLVSW